MRFIRYVENNESTVRIGWIYQDWVGEIEGNMFTEYRRAEARTPLEKVRLLAPILPGKIIGVGWNYVDHAHGAPERPIQPFSGRTAVVYFSKGKLRLSGRRSRQ